jgi:O-antigen ligase
LLALIFEGVALVILIRSRLVGWIVAGVIVVAVTAAGVLVYIGEQDKLPFLQVKSKLTAYNLMSRVKTWELAVSKIAEHPFVGMGYGKNMFQRLTEKYLDPNAEIPIAGGTHNTLVDVTIGAGVPAGVAYLWLMWALGKAAYGQFRKSFEPYDKIWSLALLLMVPGLFVRNTFDHMWVGTLAVMFWVIAGMAIHPRATTKASSVLGNVSH